MTFSLLPPILCYHSVDPSRSLISVSPELFAAHMDYLSAQGYRVLSMQRALERLETGDPCLRNTVVLTFDDGYENNHSVVMPILKKHGFGATFYIATGFVAANAEWMRRDLLEMFPGLGGIRTPGGSVGAFDSVLVRRRIPHLLRLREPQLTEHLQSLLHLASYRMMSWPQIAHLAAQDFEIADHAHSHPFLTELSPDAVRQELRASRHLLEQHLQVQVRSLCYPYGAHNEVVEHTARAEGYDNACTTEMGVDWQYGLNRFTLRRIMIHEGYSLPRFTRVVSPAYRLIMAVRPALARWRHVLADVLRINPVFAGRVL